MVGILGLGSRNSPPSDARRYEASSSFSNANFNSPSFSSEAHPSRPSLAAPSTNHGNTITNGFFALPHWTRRILPGSATTRRTVPGQPITDEHGVISRRPSSHKLWSDKQLPPTPRNSNSPSDSSPTSNSAMHEPKEVRHVSQVHEDTPVPSPFNSPPAQPAIYLDVYHNTPLVTQPNVVNLAPQAAGRAGHSLRQSRSTSSLRYGGHASSSSTTPGGPGTHRSRGVSLVPMNKHQEAIPLSASGGHATTPLTRKYSFWSRKFMSSSPQNVDTSSQYPSLPAVQPTSPFQVEFQTPPASSFQRHRSLLSPTRPTRRHSERASCTARSDVAALPQSPFKTTARPSTADPSHSPKRTPPRRPTTADSSARHRSRSFFALSAQSVIPPSDLHTLSPDQPTPRLSTRDSSTSRPRSATNPPLLHRLSVNLFASSPPSAAKTSALFGTVGSPTPVSRSPRPSLSQIAPEALKPQAGDSPESFVDRLTRIVSKADIAGLLASR
ncbi:hypothetical protein F5I97DRAFT_1580361 [Phlebopus sp. FC_14]|nr:hypothetical protein F5I97DRAFT_1580361 [Phlebopus sp. FC_14]